MLPERDDFIPRETLTHHERFARKTRTVRDHIRIETHYRAHRPHSVTEGRLRTTLDSMLEGCQILDFELRYSYLNQNAIRLSRKQPEELIGKRIQDVDPGFELLPVYKSIRECLADQIPRQMESRLAFPDGSIAYFEMSLLPASDGLVILTYEITERKNAETELRASEQRFREGEERYRLALDAAAFGTWKYDYASDRAWIKEICQSPNGLSCFVMEPYEAYRRIHSSDRPALRAAAKPALNRTDSDGCSLSLDMRPPHLHDLGFVATLHWYLKQQAKVVGFQEKITVIPPDLCVPIELATVCFRITQEAVTNAIRYAAPRRIEIELHKHGEVLDLTISDDGIGFDFNTAHQKALEGSSLGLFNMEERASLAGGQMEIASAPSQGTKIRVRFPHSQS